MSIVDPRPPPPDTDLVKFSEAMALCRVSRRTIYNWKALGAITVVYLPNGSPRILAASLVPRTTKVKA